MLFQTNPDRPWWGLACTAEESKRPQSPEGQLELAPRTPLTTSRSRRVLIPRLDLSRGPPVGSPGTPRSAVATPPPALPSTEVPQKLLLISYLGSAESAETTDALLPTTIDRKNTPFFAHGCRLAEVTGSRLFEALLGQLSKHSLHHTCCENAGSCRGHGGCADRCWCEGQVLGSKS